MKVLHLITRMNTGGPAVFLDHLTHAIHPSCESVIGYGYCEGNETDYTENHELTANLFKLKSLHRSLNPLDDIKAFIQIRNLIKQEQPKVVNTHTSKAGVLGRVAAKSVSRKIKVVHTFHGHLIYGYFAKYKSLAFTVVEKILASFTDVAVAITHETQSTLQKLGIGKRLNWQVIHLGIPLIEEVMPKSDGTKLLWVGRFTDIKDPFYAIEVMQELEKLKPNTYSLTMIGGGELLNSVREKAKGLKVDFTGWVDAPFTPKRPFDALLLTSKNEGMGLVILEAANFEKATIAKNVGGISEFIKDRETGFLVNGNPAAMAKVITALSVDNLEKVGKQARHLLEVNFSDESMANNYLNLYKTLLKP
jgi:glycosyltransferase involved in cell wall biosynthesis